MTALVIQPQYPVPNREFKLSVTITGSGANYARVWVTAAPDKSELAKKLADSRSSRVQIYEGLGTAIPFTVDRGGIYVVSVQEYTKGATGYGGGFEGSASGYQSEAEVGAATTLYINVGHRLVLPIGKAPDTSDLTLWCFGNNIRQTIADVHGETTPALFNSRTAKARYAALNTNVLADLASLVDLDSATAAGVMSTIITNLIAKFNAHRILGGVHAANDTDNVVSTSIIPTSGVLSAAGIVTAANELLLNMTRHFRNAKASALDVGSQGYHAPGASKCSDLANLPISGAASDPASALLLIADLWRAYSQHRISSVFHNAADITNVATALPKIPNLISLHILSLKESTPSIVPATEPTGTVLLTQSLGFKEQNA